MCSTWPVGPNTKFHWYLQCIESTVKLVEILLGWNVGLNRAGLWLIVELTQLSLSCL